VAGITPQAVAIDPKLTPELAARYTLSGETLTQKSVADPLNGPAVEIGDSKKPDFYPQLKISKWENEVNFSARFVDNDPTAARVDLSTNVVKYVKPTHEVHLYDLGFDEDTGGFEIEVLLPTKPVSNVFERMLQTKARNFVYQPPLTAEEIAEGCVRPDNIVGSYAVYHSTRKNNRAGSRSYKQGKAFHIYRPKAIDNNGVEVWCDLSIDAQAGTMTVTVPQKFLDTAAYPVMVDPTIGYSGTPGSTGFLGANALYGILDTAVEDGTCTSMSFYTNNASFAPNIKGVMVQTSDHTIITNGVTDAHALTAAVGWDSSNFSTSPSITNGSEYGMSAVPDGTWGYGYDTGTGAVGLQDSSNSYTTPTDPTDYANANRLIGIYATYTAGGGGGTTDGAGSSSGTSTATGIGAAAIEANASSTGTATATAEGAAAIAGAGSSTGVGTAAAEGAAAAAADALSAGTSTATAVGTGAVPSSGAGNSAGTSTAIMVGAALIEAAGLAAGTSAATARGSAETPTNEVITLGAWESNRVKQIEERRKRILAIDTDDVRQAERMLQRMYH